MVRTRVIGDRFKVERLLGRGGMATVYLARDEELERPVAVKVFQGVDGDRELRSRFLREARLTARLAHPNIVSVYDVGEDGGTPYIVMEYVEGENLAERIARSGGRLEPGEVVRLGLQACAGVQHAHDAGLVHRDVKPQNLLVRASDGTLKVSDFGIARAANGTRLTVEGTILGTAGYLAPEQIAGEEVTRAVDVYGLGAVLYEALTGRPPVEVESLAELATAHLRPREPVRALAPDVPPALEAAVMSALAARPEQRPGSAADLARALGDPAPEAPTVPLAGTTRVQAPPTRETVVERRRPAGRTIPRLAAAAAGLAIAAAVALALVLTQGRSDTAPVEPVPQHADPQQQARALAEWLRQQAGG